MRLLAVTAAVVAIASISTPAFAQTDGMFANATATGTEQLKPKDDATVRSVPPNQNFGRQPKLRLSNGTVVERAYLRFDLDDFDNGLRSAQLRIYNYDPSTVGFDVRTSASNWSEKTITWANAPAMSTNIIASSGKLKPNTWTMLDVSAAITPGAKYLSLVLTTTDRNPINLASEESDDRDPRLIVTENREPDAESDSASALESTPLAIPTAKLLANDHDPDGNPLTVASVAATSNTHGTVSLAGTTVTYTPDPGFVGSASFRYTISDGNGGTDSGTVNVTVANVAPTAAAVSASTGIGQSVAITLGAVDPGSPPEVLSFALAGSPAHGSVTLTGATATYTPNAGFAGADSFSYTASDGNGGVSAPATVQVTVLNRPPTASDVSASTGVGQPVQVTLGGSDPDGQPVTFAIATDAANGHATVSGNTATYTPNAGYVGSDSFTYTASDGTGGISAPATVHITVINHPPTASDLSASTTVGQAVQVTLAGSDPDGQSLVFALATDAAHGHATVSGNTATYTPNAGYVGSDSFTYTASDGTGGISAPATVHITVINHPPTASDLSASTTVGQAVQVTLAGSDPDGQSLAFALATDAAHGHATVSGNTATYTPNAGYVGSDSFTYTASDGTGGISAPATVSITVVNNPPTASDLSATTIAGQAVQVTLVGSDPDGQSVSFAIATDAANGHATISGNTATYTPNAGFVGSDSFTYTASDGTGGTSAPATVSITVRSANPTAGGVNVSADSNSPLTIPLSRLAGQLSDPDGDAMSVASVTGGPDTHGDVRISGDRVVFTPTLSYAGAASFAYTGSDGHGDNATGTVTVAVDHQPGFPLRGAFYYPWYPEAWNQAGMNPFTHYNPMLGFYSSDSVATVDSHLASLNAAHVDSAIASWWGQGAKHEDTRIPLLLSRIDATNSNVRLGLYYEPEGTGDPSVAQIVSDLQYIQTRYASDPGFLRIGGRFVVFVYDGGPGDGPSTCDMAERWRAANSQIGDAAFVVLKVFTGFKNCGSQPDGWHQYAPANAENPQLPWAFSISPGFWLATDASPRLVRNPTTWTQNVLDMVNSDAAFQLVTTFNEWGEGTSVESAAEWGTTYLDTLTGNGGAQAAVTPGSPSPAPVLSGVALPGRTLTAIPGSWPGTPGTFTFQFRRCDSAGLSCTDIPGATSGSYAIGTDDIGGTIRVLVTDTNSAGSKASLSLPSAIVTAPAVPSTSGVCGTRPTPPASYSHVVWIFFENHALGQIIGSTSTPYLTAMANACGQATNYAAIAHPSLPNYIAATSGGTQGITDDGAPTVAGHALSVPSIYQQVMTAGGSWRDFEESSSSNCPNSSSGLYLVRHDPAAYYANIAAQCAAWDVPMGGLTTGNFLTAISSGLPTFSFVTPDVCNDMHDCSPAAGDAWLRSWLPKLLAGPDYQSGNTAVFITFDENDNSAGNIVPMVAISPSTVPGTVATAAFNHYSLLRTTEDLLGLGQIGSAATAPSMASAFNLR